MTRLRREWLIACAARITAVAADTVVAFAAYLAAIALRFNYNEPRWGWHTSLLGFLAVWFALMIGHFLGGSYRVYWGRIGSRDVPRFALSAVISAALLAILRLVLRPDRFTVFRPPYSIGILTVLLTVMGWLLMRLLWRFYVESRQDESRLLRRAEHRAADENVLGFLRDKVVLVTGAGGTIGSEIVRQVSRAGVKRVIMVERGEHALYEIDREMRAMCVPVLCIPILQDAGDETAMTRLMCAEHPDIVLHAAAYKHVPMVECNPLEGLKNNALATYHLGCAARVAGVTRFVMISTDKAVNPASVMGMTKRLAEAFLLELGGETQFACVRFGNVLGSSGSVVPVFREQIERREPLTVTHPDMKRYFMSVEEAVGLVLAAAAMRESDALYTLDMGTPVKILDLAEDMIRQAGLRPYTDIPITFTGIRPGEKLFEELDVSDRTAMKTGNARIFINRERTRCSVSPEEVSAFIASHPDEARVREFLKYAVMEPN